MLKPRALGEKRSPFKFQGAPTATNPMADLACIGYPAQERRWADESQGSDGTSPRNRKAVDGRLEVTIKTQGEIEAAVCDGLSQFQVEYMGRGPKDIHAHLIGDLVVCRLREVLTAAEKQLVQSLPTDKGRDLLKQVRTHLVESARPLMEAMMQDVTGEKVLSLHHDISTVTGDEIMVFVLAESPSVRKKKGQGD